MDTREIISKLKESKHQKLKVAIADIDGVLRGKLMHRDKFISALENGFGFCSVVFGWDMNDSAYDNSKVTGWHTGYGDFDAQIDINTYRTVPWEGDIPFFLGDFKTSKDMPVCPRSLLKKIKSEAENMGYLPMYAQEFEWFNYRETSKVLHDKEFQCPQSITQGMFGYSILKMSENSDFFHDLFDLLEGFGIPLEGLHTETGPGVTEAAILYSDILESADRAVLFKTAVKEIAYRHGIIASFMAKPSKELPGCGGHIHQSLWDGKKNVFYAASSEDNMSEIMRSFIAGQLYCLPKILPMFAPTINSYKRLVEGAWAPTTLTWGVDNRTTSLRAITASEKSTRIEHRVVGSDVNPYLAMAACLASGLYGIKHKLKLDISKTTGNGYKDVSNGILPANLYEAANRMKDSSVAIELFGESFVNHFCGSREWEWRQFSAEVTDWEKKRYFEII
ncbi:glutamine synthetase family protein [Sinomicrobium weinanense]|uniref:Glutamine synthetase n=1 Tax=Sinomicrobium weinanense TaxID=2842200 RepID=A0A926JTS1_9FLAO|nr:glutamine synthetase [Sinomicrobium weinanense]MBC9797345.1 glutamine synthetase [Sinomicrobium weinanense]MBU3124525.1 glutamine synthetase [Sinomicrobium weinanense]